LDENVVELNRSAEVVCSDGPDSFVAGVGDPNRPPKIPIVLVCRCAVGVGCSSGKVVDWLLLVIRCLSIQMEIWKKVFTRDYVSIRFQ
jgi:hypothetical protein